MNPDPPQSLDDTSWLAVRNGTVEAIVKVLALTSPKPATWAEGMKVVSASDEECAHDWPELAGVFITPLVRGWRLVVGSYLGAGPIACDEDDWRTPWRRVASWCRRLSREFGDAHAFTDQAQMDWYAWILAREGVVFRQVVFEDGEFLSDRGRSSGVEARLVSRFRRDDLRDRWQPDVGVLPKIAGEWSINPWRIGPRTRTLGPGYVAVTPWGRK